VRKCQKWGLLVSPEAHKQHHTTYTDSFPILSGLTSWMFPHMLKAVPNRFVWLAVFLVITATDAIGFTLLLSKFFATS
jgi:hypothetical protein